MELFQLGQLAADISADLGTFAGKCRAIGSIGLATIAGLWAQVEFNVSDLKTSGSVFIAIIAFATLYLIPFLNRLMEARHAWQRKSDEIELERKKQEIALENESNKVKLENLTARLADTEAQVRYYRDLWNEERKEVARWKQSEQECGLHIKRLEAEVEELQQEMRSVRGRRPPRRAGDDPPPKLPGGTEKAHGE